MATRVLSIDGAAEWHRKLAQNFWPAVQRGMAAGAERGRAMLVARANELAYDTGHYADAWKTAVSGNKVTFFNQAPYAGVIEWGRRPGRRPPPSKALIPWVRAHLTVTRTFKSGKRKGQTHTRKVNKDEAPGVAFLVARAIGKRGIKGKRVLAGIRQQLATALLDEIQHELNRELEGR